MTTTNPGPAITSNPEPTMSTGNVQKQAILQTITITPASVAANTTAQQTFALSGLGLIPGDIVEFVSAPSFQAGLFVAGASASTTVNDSLVITFGNCTASPITPAAGVYTFEVARLQASLVPAGSGYMNSY